MNISDEGMLMNKSVIGKIGIAIIIVVGLIYSATSFINNVRLKFVCDSVVEGRVTRVHKKAVTEEAGSKSYEYKPSVVAYIDGVDTYFVSSEYSSERFQEGDIVRVCYNSKNLDDFYIKKSQKKVITKAILMTIAWIVFGICLWYSTRKVRV